MNDTAASGFAPGHGVKAADLTALARLVEEITVDCYDVEEQVTAFFEAFASEVELPVRTVVLGMPVEVADFGIDETGRELIALCRRGDHSQELSLTQLVFSPDSVVGWLHAAYRRCLGLRPYPATQPTDWELGNGGGGP